MHHITYLNSFFESAEVINILLAKNKLRKAFIITDENVFSIYQEDIKEISQSLNVKTNIKIITPGDASKDLSIVKELVASLINNSHQRDTLIINIGGGVVTDLGGFVASNYLRGVNYINIPTTIIGQIDAAIGGKTAINMFGLKNNFGSFYNPLDVLIYPKVTETLPEIEVSSGYGEIAKYAVLTGDKNLILEDYSIIVKKSVDYKLDIVKDDYHDKGRRNLLNLGHTLGHGLEVILKMPHGIAVSYGLVFASFLAYKLGYSELIFHNEIKSMFKKLNLGYKKEFSTIDVNQLANILLHDKKAINEQIQWILPVGWGKIIKKSMTKDKWIEILGEFLRGDFLE